MFANYGRTQNLLDFTQVVLEFKISTWERNDRITHAMLVSREYRMKNMYLSRSLEKKIYWYAANKGLQSFGPIQDLYCQ
jgi:hypothetical protein